MTAVAERIASPSMRSIDENRLNRDLAYRVSYLTEVIGMTNDDWNAVRDRRGAGAGRGIAGRCGLRATLEIRIHTTPFQAAGFRLQGASRWGCHDA